MNRLTIANIHFTRDKVKPKYEENIPVFILRQVLTSQGTVSSVEPGWLKLQIDVEKFPGIENIFNNKSRSGDFKHMYLCFSHFGLYQEDI